MSSLKKIATRFASTAVAVALAATATVATTGTAQAVPTTFALCNDGGGYQVAAEFPSRGGFTTYFAFPGKCVTATVGTSEKFNLNIRGLGSSTRSYWVFSLTTFPTKNTKVRTTGGLESFKCTTFSY